MEANLTSLKLHLIPLKTFNGIWGLHVSYPDESSQPSPSRMTKKRQKKQKGVFLACVRDLLFISCL